MTDQALEALARETAEEVVNHHPADSSFSIYAAILTALRKVQSADSARLDWLDKHYEQIFCLGWNRQDKWVLSEEPKNADTGSAILGEGVTVREAIDNAMKEETK